MPANTCDSRARGRERRRTKLPTPPALPACLVALVSLFAACAAAQSDGRAGVSEDTAATETSSPPRAANHPSNDTNKTSQAPSPAQTNGAGGTLFDYRRENVPPPPHLPESELRQVLRAVQAPPGRGPYAVNSVVRGSFTEPRAEEAVYLFQPDGPSSIGPKGTAGGFAVVLRGARAVCQVETDGSNFIMHKSDLDGDGLDELLLESSAFNMGIGVTMARLVELRGCRLNVVHDFGTVERDSCNAAEKNELIAGVLRYAPADKQARPRFSVEFFRAPCPGSSGPPDPSAFRPAPDVKTLSP